MGSRAREQSLARLPRRGPTYGRQRTRVATTFDGEGGKIVGGRYYARCKTRERADHHDPGDSSLYDLCIWFAPANRGPTLPNPIDTLRRWSQNARLREFIAVALLCGVTTVIVTLI